jgi:hypothetical protein
LYQDSFSIIYLFIHTPTWLGHADANPNQRVYISTWGVEFCQVSIFAKLVCQAIANQFFMFCQN